MPASIDVPDAVAVPSARGEFDPRSIRTAVSALQRRVGLSPGGVTKNISDAVQVAESTISRWRSQAIPGHPSRRGEAGIG